MKFKFSLFLLLFIIVNVFLINPATVSAEYEYDWGYMWWLSNSSTMYDNATPGETDYQRYWSNPPKYPEHRYGHWSEPLSWDGWEAYDIKWSGNVANYSDLAGAPPQRAYLQTGHYPAEDGCTYISGEDGPFTSDSGIDNYFRKVAIVYYRRAIPDPTGVNLTATYLDQGEEYYNGDSTVDVGVNVKNYSNPSAAYSNVHTKITFNGTDYNANISIPAPGDAPNGTDFIFTLDSPMAVGNYDVTIHINDNDDPHETLPTEATAQNDNVVTGVIRIVDLPPAANVHGSIDLIPNTQIQGLDSMNRIKSGYGFGLKLNESNNLGEVKAENFYYQTTDDGYIKVDYATISNVTNFEITTDKNIPLIVGMVNDTIKKYTSLLLSSNSSSPHSGNLNWDFQSKDVDEGDSAFKFFLDNNSFGANGDKPLLYLPPTTQDDNYKLNVAGRGTAEVTYRMKQKSSYEHYTESRGWHTHTRYSYWWDGPNTISIQTISLPFEVKDSMFEDDTNIIN